MSKNAIQAVLTATQGKLDDWRKKIHQAGETKKQQLLTYKEKKRQLLPLLIEGQKEGVSTRELEQITGINHTTIAIWIKQAKEKHDAKPT
jgi:metal-dependent amidase/aminoacylase/carboxypeptidase family protein